MRLSEDVRSAVAGTLGADVVDAVSVGGGDINEAWRLRLADGRDVFLKRRDSAPRGLYRAEEEGLRWLAESATLTTPRVLAAQDADDPGGGFLALAWVSEGPRGADFDERLGDGLARMHRSLEPGTLPGLTAGNFIGPLAQDNTEASSWAEFYGTRRLLPMARRSGLDAAVLRRIDGLVARLDGLLPDEPMARLHGDLWSGNVMADAAGVPLLVDPAVYRGAREVDLAMMRLFGGFSQRCFDAYEEAWPLPPGAAERVPLYQLYPLLVHVILFGAGYGPAVLRALDALD